MLEKQDDWFRGQRSADFSAEVGKRLELHFNKDASKNTLRLSRMGPQCPRALWHSIHTPEKAETLPPWAINKYAYGHILEALAITEAKAAGHSVVGEQDAVSVDGIIGHRDCVIDGCVVDVKSCSSRAFDKLKFKTLLQNDSFGYLDQLDGYLVGSAEDPLVTCKDTGYILGIDKVLGHMVLYEHKIREQAIRSRIKKYKDIVSRAEPPDCECGVQADGRSGNVRLDVKASYSAYKHCCFPKLRTFLYSDGPRYLVKVVRRPEVVEIDKNSNVVYH